MSKDGKFGTFGGVFTPSILTILGVIMYLRLPWIVGQAGLPMTILIVVVAHIISFTTGLSVASIATDKHVGAGGSYFIISRSLGLPIGGTLGIALFVGISFSISLYLIGFSESFLAYWGLEASINNIRITGSIALLVVSIVTIISTALAMKTQYVIMGAILVSLGTIFLGPVVTQTTPAMSPAANASFALLFGIFFPAVTGFEAGISMSGDLKNPKKNIPIGTMAAILVGFFFYIGLSFFFAWFVDAGELRDNTAILTKISIFSPLLMAGIWGATISSALGGILGAPRILQAMSFDKITSRIFAKGHGAQNEPRRALILTALIALCGILIGELDVIARLVSMFFITAYGFLNLVSVVESMVSPDFRPTFKVPKWIAVIGAVTCFIVMIQLDILGFIGATLVMFLLFVFLKRKELKLESGDVWEAVWTSIVRRGLLHLNFSKFHQRNWRPNLILFGGDATTRPGLFSLARSLVDRRGIITSFEFIETTKPRERNRQEPHSNAQLFMEIPHRRIETSDIYQEMDQICSHYGIAGFDPNTVMLGRTHRQKQTDRFIPLIQSLFAKNYNILLMDGHHKKQGNTHDLVDIWWAGQGNNFTLAISLVRFLQQADEFRDAKIRFFILMNDPVREERVRRRLVKILNDYRLVAQAFVLHHDTSSSFVGPVIHESAQSRLVILGLPDFSRAHHEVLLKQMDEFSQSLFQVLWIKASSFFQEHKIVESEALDCSIREPVLAFADPELNKDLKSPLEELARKLQSDDLDLSEILDYQISLLKNFHATMIENFSNLDHTIDRLSDYQQFQKKCSELIYALQTEFQEFAGLLNRNAGDMAHILQDLSDRLDAIISEQPKYIKVAREYDFFKANKGDSLRVRFFKFRKRFFHLFRKKAIRQKLAWRKNLRYYILETYLASLKNALDGFYREQNAFLPRVDGLLKNLDRFVATPMGKTIESPLNELMANITAILEHVHRSRNDLREIKEDRWKRVINHLGVDLGSRLWGQKQTRNKDWRKLVQISREYGTMLQKNAQSLFSHYELEGKLLFERYRLHSAIEKRLRNNGESGLPGLRQIATRLLALPVESTTLDRFDEIVSQAELSNNKSIRLDQEIHEFMKDLPEHHQVLTGPSLDSLERADQVVLELGELFLRKYLESVFEMEIAENIKRIEHEKDERLYNFKNQLNAANQILQSTQTNPDEGSQTVPETQVVTQENYGQFEKKLQQLISDLDAYKHSYSSGIEHEFEKLFQKMFALRLIGEHEQVGEIIRDVSRKKYLINIRQLMKSMRTTYLSIAEKIIYKKSEALVYAGQWQAQDSKILLLRKLNILKKNIQPSADKLQRFSNQYRRLFPGKMAYQRALWHDRVSLKLDRLPQMDTRTGPVVLGISGPRESGKTWLSRHIAEKYYNRFKVYQIFPERLNLNAEHWSRALQLGLPSASTFGKPVLPQNSVLIINDLELFWERRPGGEQLIRQILEWVQEQTNPGLIILNMNPYFRKFMNQFVPLEEKMSTVIDMTPFSAQEISNLILHRQQASGMELHIQAKSGEKTTVLKQARLFHRLFEFSHGRPGVAMQAWNLGLENPVPGGVLVKLPSLPDFEILENLPVEWNFMLIQMILHKKLQLHNMVSIFGDQKRWYATLEGLERCGMIVSKNNVFEITTLLQPHIEAALVRKGYL